MASHDATSPAPSSTATPTSPAAPSVLSPGITDASERLSVHSLERDILESIPKSRSLTAPLTIASPSTSLLGPPLLPWRNLAGLLPDSVATPGSVPSDQSESTDSWLDASPESEYSMVMNFLGVDVLTGTHEVRVQPLGEEEDDYDV